MSLQSVCRGALHSLLPSVRTAFARGADAPVMGDAALAGSPRIGVVAVGGVGGDCLRQLGLSRHQLPQIDRCIAVDTAGSDLVPLSADHKIKLGDTPLLMDDELAAWLVQCVQAQLCATVSGLDIVVLVAGLGGACGSSVAPALALALRRQGVCTLGVAIMPPSGAGLKSQRLARHALAGLDGVCRALIPLFRDDMTPQDIWCRRHSAPVHPPAMTFFQLCQSVTQAVGLCAAAGMGAPVLLSRILATSGGCAFAYATSRGSQGLAVAADAAMADPSLGWHRLSRASMALLSVAVPRQSPLDLHQHLSDAIAMVRAHLGAHATLRYTVTEKLDCGDDVTVAILASGIALD